MGSSSTTQHVLQSASAVVPDRKSAQSSSSPVNSLLESASQRKLTDETAEKGTNLTQSQVSNLLQSVSLNLNKPKSAEKTKDVELFGPNSASKHGSSSAVASRTVDEQILNGLLPSLSSREQKTNQSQSNVSSGNEINGIKPSAEPKPSRFVPASPSKQTIKPGLKQDSMLTTLFSNPHSLSSNLSSW